MPSASCCAALSATISSAAWSLRPPVPSNPIPTSKAQVYILSKDEGGRHTPFFNGYKPQFYIRTTDVTGTAELPEGMEMAMPGDNVPMKIKTDLSGSA